ncbi:hypothetical protein [Pseudactinotalea suaedae]|uniref:hypothetical protein n=1 Tax=Pseudactinotalea suaedae TaxID=1524924 RepID=UPI0012E1B326|nr:hypothetical protein [Pseudactinotalea suaedae]
MTALTGRIRHVALALGVALLATLAVAQPAPAGADSGAGPSGDARPVVLVGVPGLQWSDAEQLSGFLGGWSSELAAGSLVVRSTGAQACPVDGWLAVSAGNRASGGHADEGGCVIGSEPSGGQVPEWDQYLARADDAAFGSEPGLLGDTLAAAGVPATAIGAGAAVALASADGVVNGYQPYRSEDPEAQVQAALESNDLVVVDVGATRLGPLSSMTRPEAVTALAEEVAAIAAGAEASGRDPVILVSGISDAAGDDAAALRFFASIGLGAGEISSPSTRQPGYLLATDQHATVLDLLGVDPGSTSSIGGAMTLTPADPGGLVAAAQDRELHAQAQRPLIPGFFLSLVLINLALYAVVTLGLRRPKLARRVADRREPILRTMRIVSLAVAGIPVASYLTNLLPWWRVEPPLLALLLGIAVIDAAIVTVALLGPWRRAMLGPAAVVAGVTAIVLAIDVLTGARLQVSAIMGIPTLVAGRFYGMNNTSFALFSASLLLMMTAVANGLVTRGRRRAAAIVVAVVGAVAITINGAPFWGADFGGPPAMLVAFALLALLAAGIRLSVKRVALVVVGAGVITMLIAFLDWLRPASARTHLGRFFADVLDGDMWPVIGRKLDQNLTILLGNRPLTILAICGVLLVVLVLIRPVKETITSPGGGEYAWLSNGAPISAMAKEVPMLGPGLVALAVCAGIGFAVNDSGIAIPAIGVAVAVPLLLASCATWMLALRDSADPAPERSPGPAQAPR